MKDYKMECKTARTILETFEIDLSNKTAASRSTAKLIDYDLDDPLSNVPLVFELFGINYGLLNISSNKFGELLTRYFITEVANCVLNNVEIDPQHVFDVAQQRANKLLNENPWIPGSPIKFISQVSVAQIAKPKKVSNKDKAIELFKTNKHLENKQLVQLFVDTLDMTKAGATTYAYNVKNVWI